MPFFSRFRGKNKDAASNAAKAKSEPQQNGGPPPLHKPSMYNEDGWLRKEVSAEEIQELIHYANLEMKSRDLDMPFLMLPFRPNADLSAARNFIRSFFKAAWEGSTQYHGAELQTELRLLEPVVLCSITKWCWSRLRGGVIGWDTYNLFQTGEKESHLAKNAFDTFLPLSVDSEARKAIILDFFDLLAAIAANGKTNGLGGRKLSRLAGWWAFEHSDTGKGFDGGYKSWASAADATSHLFFAYLRSLAPGVSAGSTGISQLPRSLQALLADTEYPPAAPSLHHSLTSKVVMIVENVSPTPYSLLRRTKHFEYRDEDSTLQRFSEYEDPVKALTFECRRVLDCISSTNQSAVLKSPAAGAPSSDASWARFEDMGFTSLLETNPPVNSGNKQERNPFAGLQSQPVSGQTNLARPTTPSWADFLSSGFPDDSTRRGPGPLLLPTQQILPPISPARVQSSQSHVRNGLTEDNLEPGELASINRVDLDETFWWVWMSSLAGEEPPARKAVFGRCAVVETEIFGGQWLVMEEQVKGAAAQPDEGAYIVEKKRRFGFTKRSRERRSSTGRKNQTKANAAKAASTPVLARPTVNPDQHAKVQEAARDLVRRQNEQRQDDEPGESVMRRGRNRDGAESKANSVMSLGLQPTLKREAGPALEWSRKFDKDTIRARYLGDPGAGTGIETQRAPSPSIASTMDIISAIKAVDNPQRNDFVERDLPPTPSNQQEPVSSQDTLTVMAPPSQPPPPPPGRAADADIPSSTDNNHPTSPSHRYKESEKTVVSPDALNHTARKPVGSVDRTPRDHPAFRQPDEADAPPSEVNLAKSSKAPSPATGAAAAAAAAAMKNSNSAQTAPPPQVQKSKVGSTKKIRNLFSRKKTDEKSTEEPEALAMHRAISEQNQNGRVGQKTTLRKPAPQKVPPSNIPTKPDPPIAPTAPQPENSGLDEGEPGPEVESPHQDRVAHSGYGANTDHPMHPNHSSAQFSNFTQGPLEDQPAFDPDERVPPIPDHRRSSVSWDSKSSPAAAGLHDEADHVHPVRDSHEHRPSNNPSHGIDPRVDSYGDRDMADDEISDQSAGGVREPGMFDHGNTSDRWAQIRKNAAERRATEEQQPKDSPPHHSSQSARTEKTDRTDDGETSGEETIESRVARIRARVAQLTGGQSEHSENSTAAK